MKRLSFFGRTTGLLLLAGLFISVIVSCSAPAGSADDGKRWYAMHNCFACHGENGNDGKAPVIKPLDIGYRHFLSTVRDAGSPIMPKYPESKIPDSDVADIYAWLTTP